MYKYKYTIHILFYGYKWTNRKNSIYLEKKITFNKL